MDRLLCGDVGYGKTEVALRAAFKAVMDGKQVALPGARPPFWRSSTTPPCSSRFAGFPVNVEMLSPLPHRRRSRSEILRQLRGRARLDMVIGTHRLLGKDVKFKDLGLLIVDEEQRFGVAHKEKHQAAQEPGGRADALGHAHPAHAAHVHGGHPRHVASWRRRRRSATRCRPMCWNMTTALVRDAILRELARGGQVYLLYNRVQQHRAYATTRLQQLVPEARIAVGHGQMREHALEDVMLDFYEGKFDVLLCTTIIEAGLDVPRGQHADRLRRGPLRPCPALSAARARGALQPPGLRLPDRSARQGAHRGGGQAPRRPSGSSRSSARASAIAMRDLEIRGAGNLLGAEQQRPHGVGGLRPVLSSSSRKRVSELRGEARLQADVETQRGAAGGRLSCRRSYVPAARPCAWRSTSASP